MLAIGKIDKDTEVFSLYPQIKRAFGATNLDEIFTWMYASYVLHNDMKSRTGNEMSVILGVTHFRFSKQKWNTK